jgi:hypothetical protein
MKFSSSLEKKEFIKMKRNQKEVRRWQDINTGTTNDKLNKAQSQSILDDLCPWCEFNGKCEEVLMDGRDFKECKIKSWDLHSVWVRITKSKNRVNIGEKYGLLTVKNKRFYISKAFKKDVSQIWWICQCDCGNYVTQRGYALLSRNTLSCGCVHGNRYSRVYLRDKYTLKRRKYNKGSMINPDGTRHIDAIGRGVRVGCKTEHLVEIENKDNPDIKIRTWIDDRCSECNSLIRYNSNSEKQCENPYCGLIY